MRTTLRRVAGGLTVAGGAVLLRPGTRANHLARTQLDRLGRRLRYAGGRVQGASYRLRGHGPDPEVAGSTLADRVRSTLGPLEKRLDIPHVHVMAEDHVVLLHGEVPARSDADRIEAAVAAVPGVHQVESYLHVGLGPGVARPSAGRSAQHPSDARKRLLDAAAEDAAVDATAAPSVVRAVLATFAERLPEGERDQVATHLPADVRSMFSPPRRLHAAAAVRTPAELASRVASRAENLPADHALGVTRAVLGELRALVPEEAADVAAVLPAELRDLWERR